MTSITQTVKYMEAIITFFVFGNLALASQYANAAAVLPTILLWAFILSVYVSVFELDLMTVEASNGQFVERKTERGDTETETWELQLVKDNYIRRIRRPFEIIYLLCILLLLAILILYSDISLLTLTVVLCVAALMS